MGFESFRVELRGGGFKFREAEEVLRKLEYLEPDQNSISMEGSVYFLMNDGHHVLEVELMDYSPVRISCRFTLCHPPSVDSTFLGFVRELMVLLGMEARICDDVRPEQACSFR